MALNITDVRCAAFPNPKSKIIGAASLTIDGVLVLKNFKIINGANGLFVGFPSQKTGKKDNNGRDVYEDLLFFLNKEERNAMQDQVLAEWEKKTGKAGPDSDSSSIPADYHQSGSSNPGESNDLPWDM